MLEQIDVNCSEIYKFCFNLITDNNRPGFVKTYSVKMFGVAAKKDSNLKKEALIVLENIK